MRKPITLPDVGESIFELRVVTWLKQVGDTVERDEFLVEVSTEKIDFCVSSPATGTLVEITAPAEERLPVGAVVGYVEDET